MKLFSIVTFILFNSFTLLAQTTRENQDFEQMLKSGTEAAAENFYKKYPNSTLGKEAYILWQTRMINNARQLDYAAAISKLTTFKQLFPNAEMYNLAKSTYILKWNEGRATAQKQFEQARIRKNDYVKRKARRLGNDLLIAPLYFGAGYAISYYLIEQTPKQAINFGALMGGIGIVVPLSSFSIKTAPYKREMHKWQSAANYYAAEPFY